MPGMFGVVMVEAPTELRFSRGTADDIFFFICRSIAGNVETTFLFYFFFVKWKNCQIFMIKKVKSQKIGVITLGNKILV